MRIDRKAPLACLVAEDQALIAMLLEDELEGFGFEVVGPFPSCSEAMAWLETGTPAFALIDFMLSDGPCIELARTLRDRKIPFAILSGYDQESQAGQGDWAGIPWLQKPITLEPLRRAIRMLAPTAFRP